MMSLLWTWLMLHLMKNLLEALGHNWVLFFVAGFLLACIKMLVSRQDS